MPAVKRIEIVITYLGKAYALLGWVNFAIEPLRGLKKRFICLLALFHVSELVIFVSGEFWGKLTVFRVCTQIQQLKFMKQALIC